MSCKYWPFFSDAFSCFVGGHVEIVQSSVGEGSAGNFVPRIRFGGGERRVSVLGFVDPEQDDIFLYCRGGTGDSAIHTKLWSPELWIQSIWNPEPRQNNAAGWSARRQLDHDGHGQPMNKKKQSKTHDFFEKLFC